MVVQVGHPVLVVLAAEDQVGAEVPRDAEDGLARGGVLLEAKIDG